MLLRNNPNFFEKLRYAKEGKENKRESYIYLIPNCIDLDSKLLNLSMFEEDRLTDRLTTLTLSLHSCHGLAVKGALDSEPAIFFCTVGHMEALMTRSPTCARCDGGNLAFTAATTRGGWRNANGPTSAYSWIPL
jgi:hypothetical protein